MNPNRGWLFVFIGILISSFLGGAVRVLFSPERVTEFVENLVEQNQPKFLITFSSARLRLADGLKPTLAVELSDLVVKARDACITNTVIEADHFVVPLQIVPFFSGKVRFGALHADQVNVYWRESTCDKKLVSDDEELVDEIAPLERFFQQRWSIEVVRTAQYVESLAVDKFALVRGTEEWFRIEEFEMNFQPDKKRSEMTGQFFLSHKWVGPVEVAPFEFKGRINADNLSLKAHGNIKEGQIAVESEWFVNSGILTLNTAVTDVPLQSAMGLFKHWGAMTAFEAKLEDEWASCDVQFKGDIRSVIKAPLTVNNCRFYGDLGQWELRSPTVSLAKPFPLTFSMIEVDVLKWLKGFGWGMNWGIVSEFGRFGGDFVWRAGNEFQLRGQLRDFEVFLSSSRDRIKQRIKSATVDLNFSTAQFKGQLNRIRIENGEVNGSVGLDMNLSGEGDFRLNFEKIKLPSPVQRVVWGGLAPEASLVGDGRLLSSELVRFKGQVTLNALETHHWEIQNLKSSIEFDNHTWAFQPRAERFYVRPESKWLAAVNLIDSSIDPHPRDLVFHHLSAESVWTENGGRWRNFRASVPGSKAVVTSAGEWDEKARLTGFVSLAGVMKSGLNELTWSLNGNWIEPQLEAHAN